MDNEIKKLPFEKWLQYNFEQRVEEFNHGEVVNEKIDLYDWELDPETEVQYIGRLFAEPVEHTQNYTDAQISETLWLLINEIGPDLYELFNVDVPPDLRVQVVKDMYIVFEQLFAPRCSPGLSAHKSESYLADLNPLNSICYMWWDIIPLYGKSGDPNREVLDSHCIDVMERTLYLDSIACQESALHGLGHWKYAYPEQVQKIIDDFLGREHDIDRELHQYAIAARRGMVL